MAEYANHHAKVSQSVITKTNSLALKGLACLVIVLHHFASYKGATHQNVLNEFLVCVCGYIAVAMFFFLSGYGVMESEKHKKLTALAFIKRRLSKVYIPFVLTNILLIIALIIVGSYSITFENIIAHSIGYQLIDSVTWFVPVTLLFYLFVLLLSGVRSRLYKAIGMIGLWLGFVTSSIFLFDIPFYAYVSSPAFPLGYIASLYSHEICQFIHGTIRVVLLVMCIGAFVFLSLVMMGHFPVQGHLLHGVIALNDIVLVGIVVATFAGKHYAWFHCNWLGNISYEVYLCHAKIFMVYIAITGTFATFHPLLLLAILPIAFVVNKVDKVLTQISH